MMASLCKSVDRFADGFGIHAYAGELFTRRCVEESVPKAARGAAKPIFVQHNVETGEFTPSPFDDHGAQHASNEHAKSVFAPAFVGNLDHLHALDGLEQRRA